MRFQPFEAGIEIRPRFPACPDRQNGQPGDLPEQIDTVRFDFLHGVAEQSVGLQRASDVAAEEDGPVVGSVGGAHVVRHLRTPETETVGEAGDLKRIGIRKPMRKVEPERHEGRGAESAPCGKREVRDPTSAREMYGPSGEDVRDDEERVEFGEEEVELRG